MDRFLEPLVFRPPLRSEIAFVEEMLVAACFPPDRPVPTATEALAFPHAARWLRPPLGSADVAVVALRAERPAGAAVGRLPGGAP